MLSQADREVLAEVLDYPWTGKVRYFPSLEGNIYRPGRGQRHFNNSNAWARGLFGGRGSGKTTAGAQEAVRKISQGQPGIVANPDFENLKTSTWPALLHEPALSRDKNSKCSRGQDERAVPRSHRHWSFQYSCLRAPPVKTDASYIHSMPTPSLQSGTP